MDFDPIENDRVWYGDINHVAAFRDAPDWLRDSIVQEWPITQWGECAAVIFLESGNDARASRVDDIERSYGLMQVNINAHPLYDPGLLLTPDYNLRAGYQIWLRAGRSWRPWWNAMQRLGLS